MSVPWFIWSLVIPGGHFGYDPSKLRWQPVKQFDSREEAEAALPEYQVEAAKAFPDRFPPGATVCQVTWPTVQLKCSPVYPG